MRWVTRLGAASPGPPSMRREVVKVPVPDDERQCCDAEKKLIGTRVRLTIECRPGEAFVWRRRPNHSPSEPAHGRIGHDRR